MRIARIMAAVILVAPAIWTLSGCAQQPVQLLANGQSRHIIVLPGDASPSEKTAAKELQEHFKACSGVELPIATPQDGGLPGDAPMIVIGMGEWARKLGVSPESGDLGRQGFIIRTAAPHLVIAGTKASGTLYGVHRFLADYMGVRWIAPGVTKTPKISELTIPPTNSLVKPAFQWRHTSYAWPGADLAFRTRQGENNGGAGPDGEWGEQENHDGRCHSYFRYISPGSDFKDHPEFFSELGGQRVGTETQLCLTNPQVLEIVTEKMLARMRESPGVRQHNFSQMDYYNYCTCPNCREMNEKYGTTGGTQFWFVNQLAERTSKEFPDKLIGTLAYTYTEEPPKDMKMHPNVAVWLCHMFPSCDSHPIATCPLNAEYKRRAEAWAQICDHLYIWHYCVDFAHYYNPFPNFRAMAADMRFYRDIGVEGIYLQGMGHGGGGGEFSLLRPYYGMQLLWNPDHDPDAIMNDFLEGYYGAAARPIRDYITMLHDKVEKDNIHMHLYTNPAMGYLTDEIMEKAEKLFAEAESLVKDDAELLERVKVCRMPLVYARAFPRNGYRFEKGKLVWNGPGPNLLEITEFIDRAKKHGFKTIREQEGDPNQMLMLCALLARNLDLETIKNEHLWVDVVPLLAGRAIRIVDLKTKKSVTAYNGKRCLFFPFCGGLENRVGELFWFYGWMEPQTVIAKTANSITTQATTIDKLLLTRKLTLLPGRPVMRVESTIANPGDKPREARLRTHLELDLGDLATTRVKFTDVAGKSVDKDMTGIIAGMREGEHYYDQDAPRGAWTLAGSKGLQFTQTVNNDEVNFTWLYAYPDYLGQLEIEIWTKRRILQPGESFTYSEDIEIKPVAQE
ncbi:MAG TPA: DUF4838 domain-containing protein [Candidatus Brocadiia bacterium]|nr:DUF4838 domain-containing protein [Candidatus Brocadiia bacterium]